MQQQYVAYSLAHPAEQHRIGAAALLYGVFASPVACGVDLLVDYALVGHACYPGEEPLSTPFHGFSWVWWGVLAIHLAMLAVIGSAGLLSWWIASRTGASARAQIDRVMETGSGRNRYLALVGLGFALMFFVVTAAETISMAMVRLCAF